MAILAQVWLEMNVSTAILLTASLSILKVLAASSAGEDKTPMARPQYDLEILSEQEAYVIIAQEMERRERAADERLAKISSRAAAERIQGESSSQEMQFNRLLFCPHPTEERDAKEKVSPHSDPSAGLASLINDREVYEYHVIMLSGLADISTERVNYSIFMAIGEDTREAAMARNSRAEMEGWENYEPEWLPEVEDFSGEDPEYLVVGDGYGEEGAFSGLDALHRLYKEKEEELKIHGFSFKYYFVAFHWELTMNSDSCYSGMSGGIT